VARLPAWLLPLALVLAAGSAGAEHEVFYRFYVLGFVKDDGGRPLAARRVEVIRDKTGLRYRAQTDERGFYIVRVRLGDESLGEALTLRVDPAATSVTARFDPANHKDERGTRVDLEGTRFVERAAWFPSTLAAARSEARR
jgi:hypothetical protein